MVSTKTGVLSMSLQKCVKRRQGRDTAGYQDVLMFTNTELRTFKYFQQALSMVPSARVKHMSMSKAPQPGKEPWTNTESETQRDPARQIQGRCIHTCQHLSKASLGFVFRV